MGPQHIAAENSRVAEEAARVYGGFNGAAAHRCGKRCIMRSTPSRRWRFNGAAAHRCGKLFAVVEGLPLAVVASMGPQHIAAENSDHDR